MIDGVNIYLRQEQSKFLSSWCLVIWVSRLCINNNNNKNKTKPWDPAYFLALPISVEVGLEIKPKYIQDTEREILCGRNDTEVTKCYPLASIVELLVGEAA